MSEALRGAVGFLAGVGGYVRFSARSVLALPRLDVRQALDQAWEMGAGSLLVVVAVCGFAGAMLAVQGFASLTAFGAPELLGMFVALTGVREVFPMVGAGCVGAKLGSAVAAEVASLRMGQQLDALEVMAVDPLAYVVAPRMVSSVVVTPLLVGAGLVAGLASAYVVAVLQLGVDPGNFLARTFEALALRDVAAVVVKGLAFGSATGSLACFAGYAAMGGPAAVGRAANRAVVQAMVVGALLNLAISNAFYGGPR